MNSLLRQRQRTDWRKGEGMEVRKGQTAGQGFTCGPNLACHLFDMTHVLRMVLTFLVFEKKNQKKGTISCILLMKDTITCKLYDIQILVSINKILLVHINTYLFICYLWLLLH